MTAVVKCRDCDTPVTSAISKRRRLGSGCWRKRRKAEAYLDQLRRGLTPRRQPKQVPGQLAIDVGAAEVPMFADRCLNCLALTPMPPVHGIYDGREISCRYACTSCGHEWATTWNAGAIGGAA